MADSKQIIEQWVRLFNAGDANKISELYHDDAINHQVTYNPIKGKNAIFKMFDEEFKKAKMVCIIENIFVDGDWTILEWKDPNGLRGSGFFNIENGKIKFQRGYWDRLTFLRLHNLPLPKD